MSLPPPDDDMLFDAHSTHDMFPICTKLEPSNRIGGVLGSTAEKVFLVSSQVELFPIVIEELDIIANGLQVEVLLMHAKVLSMNMRAEVTSVTAEASARKALPDPFTITELFTTIHELCCETLTGEVKKENAKLLGLVDVAVQVHELKLIRLEVAMVADEVDM